MTAPDPRNEVAESIEHAITSLAEALVELDRIPAYDQSIGFVAHAMNNYLSVTEATLTLLRHALRDHPNPEIAVWLDGLRRLGNMMHHAMGRLLHTTTTELQLKQEYVNVPLLMERACDYYRPIAQRSQLELNCRSLGDIPAAWADRVLLAVVADTLLSNAVKYSNPGGEIVVQIMPGPGGVVCSVRDHGPGLTTLEQAQLFDQNVMPNALSTIPADAFALRLAKHHVDRMRGRLWSDSEPEKGTCFSVRLPYHRD
jgi:signal transduction histidine kinase